MQRQLHAERQIGCFRPLTGKLVLITIIITLNAEYIEEFPSPYGEVGFDRPFHSGATNPTSFGFRPLTGKLVLI